MSKKKIFNQIDKKGKGIWKVPAEKKREVNGNHSAQQAYWQDGGTTPA